MINVLILSFLSLFLVSCASNTAQVETEYTVVMPPKSLVKPTEEPELTSNKWGDLAVYTIQLQQAFTEVSLKLSGIDEYYKDLKINDETEQQGD